MKYQDLNSKVIDQWIKEGRECGKRIPHEDYLQATLGNWDVLLTPTKLVPHEWIGDLKGKKCWVLQVEEDNKCRFLRH